MNRTVLSLALFYGATFLLVGVFLPFFAVWLEWKSLEPFEISIILAAPLFVRLVFTPVISYLSDKYGEHRVTIQFMAWGALLSAVALYPSSGFAGILLVSILFSAFWTTVMPLTEAVAMKEVRDNGVDYGRTRLWGSLTFIAASLFGGYAIDLYGASAILWLLIGSAAILVVFSYMLPKGKKQEPSSEPAEQKLHWKDALFLVKSPLFLVFLFGASAIQATHAVYYSFGTLHWQGQGISSTVIGMLWAIGVIAEILLFMFSGWVVRALGAVGLLLAGAAGGIFRWVVMAFDPGLAVLFSLQILHGLTFGAGHLGAVHFISAAVPERYSATAQGLYSSFSAGLIMGLAILAAGPLYKMFSGQAYMAMAGIAFLSLVLLLWLAKLWGNGKVLGSDAHGDTASALLKKKSDVSV